eukprot:1202208-Prymnesium_polylepis.1
MCIRDRPCVVRARGRHMVAWGGALQACMRTYMRACTADAAASARARSLCALACGAGALRGAHVEPQQRPPA